MAGAVGHHSTCSHLQQAVALVGAAAEDGVHFTLPAMANGEAQGQECPKAEGEEHLATSQAALPADVVIPDGGAVEGGMYPGEATLGGSLYQVEVEAGIQAVVVALMGLKLQDGGLPIDHHNNSSSRNDVINRGKTLRCCCVENSPGQLASVVRLHR